MEFTASLNAVFPGFTYIPINIAAPFNSMLCTIIIHSVTYWVITVQKDSNTC